jgi:DNA-directed RNA polymerase subunit L
MEMKVIEEKKDKMVFELIGATHTICNVLKKEIWNNKHVRNVGYSIKHPLVGYPEFVVETDGEDVKKVIASAVQKVKKDFEKLGADAKKELK